jgi:hypothetical protein
MLKKTATILVTLSMVVNSAVNIASLISLWMIKLLLLSYDTHRVVAESLATCGGEVVCLLCGLKHLMRTKDSALHIQGLPNAFQPVLLSLFINGFASQEDPNPLNCFRIQSAASTQPYIKDFIISHFRLQHMSGHSSIARWLGSLLLAARVDVTSTELIFPLMASTECLHVAVPQVSKNSARVINC